LGIQAYFITAKSLTGQQCPEIKTNAIEAYPWYKNAIGFRFGKYYAYAPNDPDANKMLIIGNNRIILIDEKDISLSDTSNNSIVSVSDTQGKGYLAVVSYTTLNENGERSGEVFDWNRDGQAEVRYYVSGKVEYWVQGQWYEKKPKSEHPEVLVNGKWVELGIASPGKFDFRFKDNHE